MASVRPKANSVCKATVSGTVFRALHQMALRSLRGERTPSLQPTALVNEVCLRLLGWDQVRWQNRGHFLGVSA
jgi:hypothetical protein